MSISNSDDTIDSCDVIARIEELEGERDALTEELESATDDGKAERIALQEWEDDNGAELTALLSLQEQAEGYSDWQHGAQLVRDSYFEDHAREVAENVHGRALLEASWPMSCIDWEKAANELQMDYTSVDFDGVTYWVRS